MRIAADEDGNIVVGYMVWPSARCQIISRFDKTNYIDNFPFSGRSKHVAVDMDDKYIHVAWLGMDGVYGIYYARRNKAPNSPWSTVIKVYQPPNYPPDRPFIQVGSRDSIPQLVYLHNVEGGGREMHHRTFRNNKFTEAYLRRKGDRDLPPAADDGAGQQQPDHPHPDLGGRRRARTTIGSRTANGAACSV